MNSTHILEFEALNNTPVRKSVPHSDEQVLSLNTTDVQRTLKKVNTRKVMAPDNIPGWVLNECADQLAPILTDIFNTSLNQAVVPSYFKNATIIPVPQKSNDYRPVALTPILMKCFKRLVKDHIISKLPPHLTLCSLLTGKQTGTPGP